MEQSVVDLISSCLDSGNYKEALSASVNEKYTNDLTNNCWDLITAVIGKIEDDTLILKPSLYGTCETLLANIVKQCSPEEALFEFIEQIQVAKNDAQFAIVLEPVQHLLIKLSTKRFRSLEFTLDSMSSYITSIPLPEHQLEGKERLLMESDVNIRRIIKIYSLLPPFYNPLIKEITLANANNTTKDILAAFLISLLGKPLIYVDLDPDCNANSEARICSSSIIQDICILVKNVNKFLDYVEFHHKQSLKPKSKNILTDNEEKLSPYDYKEKINMTTLSGLFYGIYSGHFEVPEHAVPVVYSTSYVVHTNLLCVVHLLSFAEYGPLAKGMTLCTKILNRYPTNTSHSILKNSIHYSLCQSLVNIAIYSSYESLRKEAVKLISTHINKFEYKGRSILIKYILNNANHSGMIGYAISLYKNSIEEAFRESDLPDCFTGPQLLGMIKKMCYLPHGAESDLVELADQIITALNFLRYLALKDNLNKTGIRECFTIIEDDYLKKLRTALNMSRAHYEVKLMDINNSKGLPEEQVDISINIGGNMLDKIPTESKKQIIHSALNAFHLIEGLVARLAECIKINKTLRISHRLFTPIATISFRNAQNTFRNYCQGQTNKEIILTPRSTEQDERQYEEDIKRSILAKALDFVLKTGWSIESLAQGAEAVGYPGVAHGLFPNGGGDLVHYFNITCNENLVEQMKSWPKEELKESKVPAQLIENAIMTRLLMIDPYKNTWPKAMAIQTLPNNVPNCLATLLSLVDDICYHTGDRSVDFNWYIRRVGLAGIYKASELFYLTDNSQSNSGTRSFVKSRIRDAELIQIALNVNPVAVAPQTLTAAFVTAKNMLGMNTLK